MKMTLSRWNALIDTVNDVVTNPPSDSCPTVAPIPHVESGTVWKQSHFRAIHNAIKTTCPSVNFTSDLTKRIRESYIQEILDQLSKAWCDCQCQTKPATDENGKEVVVFAPGHIVYPSFDDPGGPYPTGEWNVKEQLEGFALAIPGFRFRDWTFEARSGPVVRYLRGGQVRVDGTVDASTINPADKLEETVIDIVGGSCVFRDADTGGPTPDCAATLAIVEAREQSYVLRLSSVLAQCDD